MSEEDKKQMSEEEKVKLIDDVMSKLGMGNENNQVQSMSMADMMAQKTADQEILTFDFLKQVITSNGGDEGWQGVTLDQYHQDTGAIKMQFSAMALNFLTHEKREQLQQQVWSAPYGFFYMWQFAVNGLQYMKEDGLKVAIKLLEPLIDDLYENMDYGRFNHFGRILAIAKYHVYSPSSTSESRDKVSDLLSFLMDGELEHPDEFLDEGANGKNEDLNSNEVEACQMSVRVINKLSDLGNESIYEYRSESKTLPEKIEKSIQETLKFVEELKSEDWTGERTKLFADIEKDLNDMLEHIQPKEELSAEDVMSQLEALMNQMKEENPEAYAEVEKKSNEIMEPTKESEVDLNVNMELSTAMWQAGRYTSFHEWLGDYPEGSPNYNNLHDNMIPKYKATKESFEANATSIITYEDFTKQMNANLDGYALEDGEFRTEEVKTMIADFIPGVEASDSFDLIANYPELIYQCGVVSASFDNGCLTDVPDHIKKHCDRWGWVMTKKIDWFNGIATGLISCY